MTLMLLVSITYGQTLLPNGDLESWTTAPGINSDYDVPGGGYFSTLNELAAIPQNVGPITVYKTTDAHSGTYAARLVSKIYPGLNYFIPGMLGTTKLLIALGTIRIGKPCPFAVCDPLRFKGWYKFSPVGSDSCKMLLALTGLNPTSHVRDTIAYGDTVIKTPVTAWTQFDIKINKRPGVVTPVDSMSVLCVSSAGFSITNLTGGVGQPETTMYIDDLAIENPAGIEQFLMPEVNVSTYPDPAAEKLTIELSQKVKHASFNVYSVQGKILNKFSLTQMKSTISVSALPSGTYYYKLTDGKNTINTGSFIIQR